MNAINCGKQTPMDLLKTHSLFVYLKSGDSIIELMDKVKTNRLKAEDSKAAARTGYEFDI